MSRLWMLCAACVCLFYICGIGILMLRYKYLFSPDSVLSDTNPSFQMHAKAIIDKRIKDSNFHHRSFTNVDDDKPMLEYKTYDKNEKDEKAHPNQPVLNQEKHVELLSKTLRNFNSQIDKRIDNIASDGFEDNNNKQHKKTNLEDHFVLKNKEPKKREARKVAEDDQFIHETSPPKFSRTSINTSERPTYSQRHGPRDTYESATKERKKSPISNQLLLNLSENLNDSQMIKDFEMQSFEIQDESIDYRYREFFDIKVYVGKWNLSVRVDGTQIFNEEMKPIETKYMKKGGLYLLVLHQSKGTIMHSSRHTSFEIGGDKDLLKILQNVQPGRIVILAAMCDAFSHLSDDIDMYLRIQGSRIIAELTVGDRWAWIWTKDGRSWAENAVFSTHLYNFYYQGGPLVLHGHPPKVKWKESQCDDWPNEDQWNTRRIFCDTYEGYGDLCSCTNPSYLIKTNNTSPSVKFMSVIPTVIVASERPLSLFRCLNRLLEIDGSDPENTLVVADGHSGGELMNQVQQLVSLYGVKFEGHDSMSDNITMRITRHYKNVFQDGFRTFPLADKIIILEEDLYVAEDFYRYFNQLSPLLDQDPSLYCASAWNDLSLTHTAADPTMVFRSETMAGLGWIITRKIYEEIIGKWPSKDKFLDWDMWMRLDDQRRGRECLVPEVPRTSHFGINGAHLTAYFQAKYFSHYILNNESNVILRDLDRLGPKDYDTMLTDLVMNGVHLDGGVLDPCQSNLVPSNKKETHILWIKMNEGKDTYTLEGVFKCLGLWDLDIRGSHKYLWRMRLNRTPFLIIGWPASYFSSLKPKDVNIMRRADPSNLTSDPPVYVLENKA